jgi:hypothetical protein
MIDILQNKRKLPSTYYGWEHFNPTKEELLEGMDEFSGEIIEFANFQLLLDKEVILKAVSTSSLALDYIPAKWLNYRDVAIASVATNGMALKYYFQHFKDDDEVVYTAWDQNCQSLLYASERLRKVKWKHSEEDYAKAKAWLEAEMKRINDEQGE